MAVLIHPHALKRLKQRGASANEAITTVYQGKQIPAKKGRYGF